MNCVSMSLTKYMGKV